MAQGIIPQGLQCFQNTDELIIRFNSSRDCDILHKMCLAITAALQRIDAELATDPVPESAVEFKALRGMSEVLRVQPFVLVHIPNPIQGWNSLRCFAKEIF